ncbi:MAG TPA: hypothetical protein VIO81_11990, partial [Methyloversatilis sp.]
AGDAPPKHAWILGAGLLHDVPLDALLALFERIDLVDVAFSPTARAAARAHPNRVACVTLDVTGVLDDLKRDPALAAPEPPPGTWVASVNILSQLPLLPCMALLAAGMPDAEVERYGQALQQAHVALLGRARHACLIIEYAQTQAAGPDEALLPALPEQLTRLGWSRHAAWHWPLNPAGETPVPEGRSMQAWMR